MEAHGRAAAQELARATAEGLSQAATLQLGNKPASSAYLRHWSAGKPATTEIEVCLRTEAAVTRRPLLYARTQQVPSQAELSAAGSLRLIRAMVQPIGADVHHWSQWCQTSSRYRSEAAASMQVRQASRPLNWYQMEAAGLMLCRATVRQLSWEHAAVPLPERPGLQRS